MRRGRRRQTALIRPLAPYRTENLRVLPCSASDALPYRHALDNLHYKWMTDLALSDTSGETVALSDWHLVRTRYCSNGDATHKPFQRPPIGGSRARAKGARLGVAA